MHPVRGVGVLRLDHDFEELMREERQGRVGHLVTVDFVLGYAAGNVEDGGGVVVDDGDGVGRVYVRGVNGRGSLGPGRRDAGRARESETFVRQRLAGPRVQDEVLHRRCPQGVGGVAVHEGHANPLSFRPEPECAGVHGASRSQADEDQRVMAVARFGERHGQGFVVLAAVLGDEREFHRIGGVQLRGFGVEPNLFPGPVRKQAGAHEIVRIRAVLAAVLLERPLRLSRILRPGDRGIGRCISGNYGASREKGDAG